MTHEWIAPDPIPGQVPEPDSRGSVWKRRLILGAIALVALVAAYFVLLVFLPRWWATTIGDLIAQSYTVGVFFGLFLGFVSTVLPLITLRFAIRPDLPPKTRGLLIGLSVLFAVPNLLTLTVVIGSSEGQQIMDANAPAFRGASLIGAMLGVVAFMLTLAVIAGRKQNRETIAYLQAKVQSYQDNQQAQEEHPGQE